MARFDDFELDLKVNVDKDNTVKPNVTSIAICSLGCSETRTFASQCCTAKTRVTC